jgi:hypothetical protein
MLHRAFIVALAFLVAGCGATDEFCDCGNPQVCPPGSACGLHGLTCGDDKTCSACSGNGGRAEAGKETSCADGKDNDCDGLIDCDDPDCQAKPGTPGQVCDAAGHTCSLPDSSGHATCGVASAVNTGALPPLGYLSFASVDHPVLGTYGSGYNEQSTIAFQVTAADGSPYPAGLTVHFSHESQGGSFIGAFSSCTPTTPSICAADGVTDAEGKARVVLTSGRQFALLSITATADVGGATRSLVAGDFAVVGAKPNGAHLLFDCRPYNVPGLTVHDCAYSRYCNAAGGKQEPVTCTLKMADRDGVVIGFPALVTFKSEAGAVSPATTSIAYDPAKSAAEQQELGHGIGFLEVCDSPLPLDVKPLPGEFSVLADLGCGQRTVNPRDGLVTVIAMVEGEEGFVDLNQNGQWDPGEPFIDLGEPYLDVNDNGVYDGPGSPALAGTRYATTGEPYVDVNGNGVYDGPNGKWDANATLWAQTRVLYTGRPVVLSSGGNQLFSRFYDLAAAPQPPAPTPSAGTASSPVPFLVHLGPPPTAASYGVFLTDQNLNPLSAATTYGIATTFGNVDAKLDVRSSVDSIGATLRQYFCDSPTPALTTCHAGPPEQACQTSPCYSFLDVGGCTFGACAFQYGSFLTANIIASKAGPDVVNVSATLENFTTTLPLPGSCVSP